MHVFAPYCNDANKFILSDLELIVDLPRFTSSLGSEESGNFFQCLFKSGWIDVDSWLDIITEVGTEEILFVDERKVRRKLGVGFEIWSGMCLISFYTLKLDFFLEAKILII